MFHLLRTILTDWGAEKNQRLKLQQAYLMLAVICIVIAGILTLITPHWAPLAAYTALFLVAVYVINGVVHALLEALVVPRLPKPAPSTAKPTKRPRR